MICCHKVYHVNLIKSRGFLKFLRFFRGGGFGVGEMGAGAVMATIAIGRRGNGKERLRCRVGVN